MFGKRIIPIFLVLVLILSGCTQPSVPTEPPVDDYVSTITTQPESPSDVILEPSDRSQTNATTSFKITFIDVGQGDSILVQCDGENMLIDGGDKSASDTLYTFLKKNEIDYLDVVVATHQDSDHVGGLPGALTYATAETVYCSTTDYDTKAFENFKKAVESQGNEIIVPNAGDEFYLGTAEIDILGPIKEYEDNNDNSIVLKITYGNNTFLMTGDMERESEQDLLECGYDLSADVLKVGHHGSSTSTSYPFLREVMPTYAVISCGVGNEYGHPREDTMSRLRDADVITYRTDLQGDIICYSDGTNIAWETYKNFDIETNPTVKDKVSESSMYIGNINSMKFHEIDCSSLPSENNSITFESRMEATDAGYTPCGKCDP